MFAINYSTLRNHMKAYFDKVSEDKDTMIVTRKDENVVIMSQSTYDSLMETVYLTNDRHNYDHLMKSIQQLKDGQTAEHALIDAEDE